MKKIFALILVFAIMISVCGCKNNIDNLSSNDVDIEYEEIVVGETGDNMTSSENKTNTTAPSDNNSSTQTPVASDNQSSAVSGIKNHIDFDTVVEVDICDDIVRGYLSAKDAQNQFYWLNTYSGQNFDTQTLTLNWQLDGSSLYTVYFSENADFGNSITVTAKSKTLNNTALVPGKTYYWKVTGMISSDILGGGRIKVKDTPVRWIDIDSVGNVRDMGGWKTTSGKTVKYGMIYRGRRLEEISDEGIATIKQLGLKTELDLRYEPSQKVGTGMNYVFIETPGQYDSVLTSNTEVFKSSFKKIFELLSDESNYPFYAHCNAGADRTGTFAFITNGLLGVSYEDLTRDFELTSFSSSGKRWRGKGTGGTFTDGDDVMQEDSNNTVAWGRLYKTMMAYGEKNNCTTLESSIEHWLLNYIGVPKSQIDSFRNIMLK